ncbi:hypothetical protein SO802_015817 [Lithocarpus litseifolius]|uniref:Uncharacterized protein n=1 Tax=Lithocarpus litseifolius TaxID=425828 RepID=A0AAW2CVA2_9ROSI
MSITLEDVEVILGLPIDGEVLVGPTAVENWRQLCAELLGFGVSENDKKTLVGQRIHISRLVERIAEPLPHDADTSPYEVDLGYLHAFCIPGRDMWTARMPLVCFCIVETHHPGCVLRQFGLAQQ